MVINTIIIDGPLLIINTSGHMFRSAPDIGPDPYPRSSHCRPRQLRPGEIRVLPTNMEMLYGI